MKKQFQLMTLVIFFLVKFMFKIMFTRSVPTIYLQIATQLKVGTYVSVVLQKW